MDKKSLLYFGLFRVYEERDIAKAQVLHRHLTDILVTLHDSLLESQSKFPDWFIYSEQLLFKFALHGFTLNNLLSGTELTSALHKKSTRLVDIPSFKVLIRAQLEAYLTYYHIFNHNLSKEEQEFRFDVWMSSSLITRQQIPATSPDTQETKANDLKQIEYLQSKISASPFFTKLTINQQKELLKKGHPRLFKSWKTLIHESEIDKVLPIDHLYSIISSYAHAEGVGILQLKAMFKTPGVITEMASINIFFSKIFTCRFIKDICLSHEFIKSRFDSLDEETKLTIEFYLISQKIK
jgi:hypothetical protein